MRKYGVSHLNRLCPPLLMTASIWPLNQLSPHSPGEGPGAFKRPDVRPTQHRKPEQLIADRPNHVWSWDITYLAAGIRGTFSTCICLWISIAERLPDGRFYEYESAELAADLLRKSQLSENIPVGQELIVHSDNGGPMKGASMLATMQKLGVVPSFSRPAAKQRQFLL